jgi:arachidonate 15-lipoxygenase
VQVADANVEESFQHLGRAHFLIEAFAMATERQLSTRHPLYVLLAPHFHGTLAINDAARDKLVVKGGQLDELLAPTLAGSLDLVRRGLASFDLASATFAGDLRARGLDATALPDHPFRDDGALIQAAIDAWVTDYLALSYDGDASVAADPELAAFVRELRASDGGRLSGVPERIETLAAVHELISFVLFTTSAHHAALNYTQADFMGWAPNMPTAAFAPVPTTTGGDRDLAWSKVLPPHGLASSQLEFMWQQSQIRDDRLGQYPSGHFTDPRVAPILARFQAALDAADAVIAERDTQRLLPYPYLRPSLLTASIHI